MELPKDKAIVACYQLVRGSAPAPTTYAAIVQTYLVGGEKAIVEQLQGTTSNLSNAQLGSLMVTNFGFKNRPDLVKYVADLFGIYGADNRGQVILNLADRASALANDSIYGAVALAFNQKVASNLSYSLTAPSWRGDLSEIYNASSEYQVDGSPGYNTSNFDTINDSVTFVGVSA